MPHDKSNKINNRLYEIQEEIDTLLTRKERAEREYIRAKTSLWRLDDKIQERTKEMFKLMTDKI